VTVEFPNDNPDLWSHRAPLAALAILLAEAEIAEDEKEADRSDPNDQVDSSPVIEVVAEAAPPVAEAEKAPECSDPNDQVDSSPVIEVVAEAAPPVAEAEKAPDCSDPNDQVDFPALAEPVAEPIVAAAEVVAEEKASDCSDPNDQVDFSAVAEAVAEPMVAAAVEEDDGPEVEVIEFDEADFAVVENESIPPPPKPDLFQVFARTLIEVALAAGAPGRVVEMLPGMLGIARLDAGVLEADAIEALVAADMLARSESGTITRSESFVAAAQAWRATILGEEADFSACTSTLDEWSATLVATLANMPQQRETFRRDLRSRGVAAFGLLVEAA
jgi:hypothetical protein